jgi:hypothetical protein
VLYRFLINSHGVRLNSAQHLGQTAIA